MLDHQLSCRRLQEALDSKDQLLSQLHRKAEDSSLQRAVSDIAVIQKQVSTWSNSQAELQASLLSVRTLVGAERNNLATKDTEEDNACAPKHAVLVRRCVLHVCHFVVLA